MASNTASAALIDSFRNFCAREAFGVLADLMRGESLVLNHLSRRREEAVFPADLSRALGLSPSRITGILSSLRRKGFVTMAPSLSDRRRVQVSVTDEGLAIIGQRVHLLEQSFVRLENELGPQDTRTLARLLNRCMEILEES